MQTDQTPFAWQTAYGIEVKMPNHPFPMDRAVFMDYRQSDPEPKLSEEKIRVPSFLYVLPADKDTVFLEETCLASAVQVGTALCSGWDICRVRGSLFLERFNCLFPKPVVGAPSPCAKTL